MQELPRGKGWNILSYDLNSLPCSGILKSHKDITKEHCKVHISTKFKKCKKGQQKQTFKIRKKKLRKFIVTLSSSIVLHYQADVTLSSSNTHTGHTICSAQT